MYDALIIVNGEIASSELWSHIQYQTLLCSDGAAMQLANLNISPNVILGDMDSVTDNPDATINTLKKIYPQAQVLPIYDQSTTDFEKALQYAVAMQYQRVLCLGTMGKAADHSLYNLALLTRYSTQLDLVFLHEIEKNVLQWIFALKPQMQIQAPVGSIISFWPDPSATLSSKGLKWELQHQLLSLPNNVSIRNQTLHETIEIECIGQCIGLLIAPLFLISGIIKA